MGGAGHPVRLLLVHRPLRRPGQAVAALYEGLEDPLPVLGRDPHPCVPHPDPDMRVHLVATPPIDQQDRQVPAGGTGSR